MRTDTYAESPRTSTRKAAGGTIPPRLVLRLDALTSGAVGVPYLVAAGPIGDALGLSEALLRGAGVVLVAFAAGVWLLAARAAIPAAGVAAVVAINALWAIDSVGALALGWLSPTAAGAVWVVLQALVVAAFAALQGRALRR